MHFLKVNEKPTNALIIQCVSTQYSPTCFGTLKCHHHGVKHDLAETGAQCRGKQSRMGAVYCKRRRDGRDIYGPYRPPLQYKCTTPILKVPKHVGEY
jgi:hypothetical protein